MNYFSDIVTAWSGTISMFGVLWVVLVSYCSVMLSRRTQLQWWPEHPAPLISPHLVSPHHTPVTRSQVSSDPGHGTISMDNDKNGGPTVQQKLEKVICTWIQCTVVLVLSVPVFMLPRLMFHLISKVWNVLKVVSTILAYNNNFSESILTFSQLRTSSLMLESCVELSMQLPEIKVCWAVLSSRI